MLGKSCSQTSAISLIRINKEDFVNCIVDFVCLPSQHVYKITSCLHSIWLEFVAEDKVYGMFLSFSPFSETSLDFLCMYS